MTSSPTSVPTFDALQLGPVIPVVVSDDSTKADSMASALAAGGIRCAEVTLRTPAALEVMAGMAEVEGFTVGAGTVCSVEQVDQVVDAGGSFVVSPGLSAAVVERCHHHRIPALPGVATASEIMQAIDLGLDVVKFFPAGVIGGVPAIKALGGPFPSMRFVPTGGVNLDNLADYLALPNVAAVGGSWLTPAGAQENDDWTAISALAADAVSLAGSISCQGR